MGPLCSAARRSGLLAAATFSIVVGLFGATPIADAQESSSAAGAQSVQLVNEARSAAGLPALATDAGLDSVARAQAARMAERDAIFHNDNLKDDVEAAGVNWRWVGENVGVGPDAGAIHDGFMASPGHRANVVYADYTLIGIGAAVGGDGSVFIAQVFADRLPAAAPAPAPVQAAPSVAVAPAPVAAAVSQPATEAPAQAAPQAKASPETTATAFPIASTGGVVNPTPAF